MADPKGYGGTIWSLSPFGQQTFEKHIYSNLDAILSVGYWVNPHNATQSRI